MKSHVGKAERAAWRHWFKNHRLWCRFWSGFASCCHCGCSCYSHLSLPKPWRRRQVLQYHWESIKKNSQTASSCLWGCAEPGPLATLSLKSPEQQPELLQSSQQQHAAKCCAGSCGLLDRRVCARYHSVSVGVSDGGWRTVVALWVMLCTGEFTALS